MAAYNQSWNTFKNTYHQYILPIYEAHENDFDFAGIHGRMHISRALILGECMLRYYAKELNIKNIDFQAARIAIAFHDAGRQGNGKDIWEQDSANMCFQFLKKAGHEEPYCHYVSNMIVNKDLLLTDIPAQIVHDADTLEIMRLFAFAKSGFKQFRQKELRFLSAKDVAGVTLTSDQEIFRQHFITSAWQWIRHTEHSITAYPTSDFLDTIIYTSLTEFPLLRGLLMSNAPSAF